MDQVRIITPLPLIKQAIIELSLADPDVEFQIACAVPIELEPLSAVEQQARLRWVQVETLINLWLQQKLAEQSPKRSRMRGSAPNTRPEGDCQGS